MSIGKGIVDFLGLTGGMNTEQEVVRLRRRVDTLEAQVAELARATGTDLRFVDVGPAVSDEVRQLALSGQQIKAIKVHREQTGAGLAEAKRDVDEVVGGRA